MEWQTSKHFRACINDWLGAAGFESMDAGVWDKCIEVEPVNLDPKEFAPPRKRGRRGGAWRSSSSSAPAGRSRVLRAAAGRSLSPRRPGRNIGNSVYIFA